MSRKVAAILAGGLVVGIGTVATLAAWNDVEYATGTFSAGKFVLLGSTDWTTFADHGSTPQALTFSTGFDNLTPGKDVYSKYALRLDKSSSDAGTVVVSAGTLTGSTTGITYSLFTTTSTTCDSAAIVGTQVVPASTPLGSVGSPTSFALTKPTGGTDGTAVNLCFKVSAASGLTQGQTATASWTFTATSA